MAATREVFCPSKPNTRLPGTPLRQHLLYGPPALYYLEGMQCCGHLLSFHFSFSTPTAGAPGIPMRRPQGFSPHLLLFPFSVCFAKSAGSCVAGIPVCPAEQA